MKLVVDMNLSPEWVAVLERHGWEAVHWSSVGNPRATDSQIMTWANTTGHVVFTHDLGFGALLELLASCSVPPAGVIEGHAQRNFEGPL